MAQQQLSIPLTPEVKKNLDYLRRKYALLSEAEVIKAVLAEKYERVKQGKEAWIQLKDSGKKFGDTLLAKRGLKRKNVTEEDFYHLFLDDHKDD